MDAISRDSEDWIGTEASRDGDKIEGCLGSEGNKLNVAARKICVRWSNVFNTRHNFEGVGTVLRRK